MTLLLQQASKRLFTVVRMLPGLLGGPLRGQHTARKFYLKAPKQAVLCRSEKIKRTEIDT